MKKWLYAFKKKCNTSWQGSSRVREHWGLLQPAGERWMIISFLISRSVIKWHRQAPFNQEKGGCWTSCCHAASPLVGFNPYFTKLQRFPLWVRNHKYPLTVSAILWFWVTLMVSVNAVFDRLISWNLCVHTCWHFFPPLLALFPVLQLTLSLRLSLTHRGSCWPPGIKEAAWLSSRGSRR